MKVKDLLEKLNQINIKTVILEELIRDKGELNTFGIDKYKKDIDSSDTKWFSKKINKKYVNRKIEQVYFSDRGIYLILESDQNENF